MKAARNILVERPTKADLPRIMEILQAVNYHRIGGAEMPAFPLEDCFVARLDDGRIAGVAGYRVLDARTAKTTLLAVDPAFRRMGAGEALQLARMDFLRARGIRQLFTNCDDEQVINWYENHFGYRRTGGRIPKVEPFGRADKNEWITLVAELHDDQP